MVLAATLTAGDGRAQDVAAGAAGEPGDGDGDAAHAAQVPSLVIDDPGELAAGTTRELTLRLQTAPGQDHPVLLTPTVEGVALAEVRGRLLRTDAREVSPGGELRFALPVQVREPGTAIVRVEALTYRCAARCMAVRVRAERTLIVH